MATCTCGHTAPDTAAFCERCGTRLNVPDAAPAPVGVGAGVTAAGPEGLKTPGPRWANSPASVPATPVFPGMPGTPLPSPFANVTLLPHAATPPPPAATGQVTLGIDSVIGIVGCIGIVIGALLEWTPHASAQRYVLPFLYDLRTRSQDPKLAHVLFALAAFGVAASLIAGARRWRVCLGLAGVVMSVAFFVQIWRALSDLPITPSYTDYIRWGPGVTLVSSGLLMISPMFGSGERTSPSRASRGLTWAIAATVTLAVAWFGIHAFVGDDGRTLVAPHSAHYRARMHGKAHVTTRVQSLFGASIATTSAVAVTPDHFEEIAEDDMPAVVAAHDSRHSASDQFAHVLVRNQMLLPLEIASSKPATFQGKDALYEERVSGRTKAFVLYVFDGSRVYVIAVMSAKSSPKAAYDALVSSFKITG